MIKNSGNALRRADRALFVAAVLVFGIAGASCAVNYNFPHTDQSARIAPVAVTHVELAVAPEAVAAIVPKPKPTLTDMAKAAILAEHNCLAEAIYYEARGEGLEGQEAVAEVVVHRMHDRNFPHTLCGVVYQGANLRHGCQFSWVCNGDLAKPKSRYAWYEAQLLAARIMTGEVRLNDITGDAVNFHAVYVQPDWANHMVRTIQIGNHVFYRWARTRQS